MRCRANTRPLAAKPALSGWPTCWAATAFLVLAAAPATGQDRPSGCIRPGDHLAIRVTGTLPGRPIAGVYRVERTGVIDLGPTYGRVMVGGLGRGAAEARVREHTARVLKAPQVLLSGVALGSPDGGRAGGRSVAGQLEYKVVFSPVAHAEVGVIDLANGAFKETMYGPVESAAAMTEQFNALAADGWEYVAPIVATERQGAVGDVSGGHGVLSLFKRPMP
jgi:hypothetical protein